MVDAQREDIRPRVHKVLRDNLGCDDSFRFRDSASFMDDLGLDSLECLKVALDCEEEFEIDLPDAVADRLLTVGQLVEHIDTELTRRRVEARRSADAHLGCSR